MKKILVICSTQRSGSTMVCDDIKNTGRLGFPNEYFLSFIAEHGVDWQTFKKQLKASSSGYVAIKVMASQLNAICHKYNIMHKVDNSFDQVISSLGDAIYVRVIRRDKVYQAISRLMANRTGVYHHVNHQKEGYGLSVAKFELDNHYNDDIKLDNAEIHQTVVDIENEEKLWDQFFEKQQLSTQVIYYEDATTDLSYINAILQSQGMANIDDLQEIAIARNVRGLPNKHSKNIYQAYKNSSYA